MKASHLVRLHIPNPTWPFVVRTFRGQVNHNTVVEMHKVGRIRQRFDTQLLLAHMLFLKSLREQTGSR